MGELSWHERGRLWMRLGLRLALTGAALVLVWKVVLPLGGLLMPFVLALVLAWMFNPAIRFLQRKLDLGRGPLSLLFVLLSCALAGGVAAGFVYTLVNQVSACAANWQSAMASAEETARTLSAWLEKALEPLSRETSRYVAGLTDSLLAWMGGAVPRILAAAAAGAGALAMSLPNLAVSTFIFLMATYFITADYPRLRFMVTAHMPREMRAFCSMVKGVAAEGFGGYIKAQLFIAFFVFLILLGGFFAMGEPYGVILALALGVLDFIPIVGAGTVMVPWAVIDLILGSYGHAAALMAVWGIIALFRRVAEPKVVGDRTGLSPISSLLAIYVGMRLGGVLGMILGPILLLVAINVAKSGVMDNTVRDLGLAARDVAAILKSRPPVSGGEGGEGRSEAGER